MKPMLCLTSLLAIPVLVSAQESPVVPVWPHEASDLKPDPKVVFGRLPNGLRYQILPHAEPPKRVSLRLHLEAGSLMEEDDQQGLAHFLEHMAFNGTKNYPAGEMVEFFQRLGMAFGADTNAHTSFDETVYKLELPDGNVDLMKRGMLFLRDVADGMIIGPQELEKERGVIISEKKARDSVEFRSMIEGFKFSLPDSLVPRRLPIGTEDVILKAPRQRFVDFYRRWYRPELMTVIVAGDVQPDAWKAAIVSQFSDLKAPALPVKKPDTGPVRTGHGLQVKLHTEKEAGQVTIGIDTNRPSRKRSDSKATRRERMIRSLADAMLNRRFEIGAKKPDAAFLAAESGHEDWMRYVESASVQTLAKPENWDRALMAAEQELRRAVQHGFTKAELAEAAANLATAAENAARQAPTRKSRELADELSRSVSEQEVFLHPDDAAAWVRAELATVTPELCHEALRRDWATDDIRIFITGNLQLENAPKQITETWNTSRAKEVAAPEESSDAAFAYTDFGAAGEVKERKEVEDLGITQLTFANGVRLNVRKTDFKKDVIELAASFGDGRLTLPKDKPGLALFTRMNFGAGGLEKHSIDDLQRLLAGRTASVSFSIGDDSFGFAGRTNRSDLLLQFQLLAASLSSPGWRPDGLSRFKASLPAIYNQVEHTPEGILQAKVEAFTHGDDYRFVFPAQEELAARTIDEMKAWVGPALASGYLEIGVVGDLDVEEVVRAAAATVGALPARAAERSEHAELRKVSFPAKVSEKEWKFTSKIPKSNVLVFWPTTDRRSDVKLSRQLSLLAEVFSDRVRKKVREELGDSYSPDVASMMSDTWEGYGQIMAMMVADGKDAAKLGEIAKEIGRGLAAKGVTADELDRARKPILTMLEEQRRSNAYWLGTVVLPSQSRPERLDWARSMMDDFKSVTLAELNALAAKYLGADTVATVVRVVASGGEAEKPGK
jgi:zinc protease